MTIQHLFLMTGACPNTAWLERLPGAGRQTVHQDRRGTGNRLAACSAPPYLLETSLPGVFAVGDVRAGSMKRVASAVGEGSMAVQFVHKVLAD